MEIKNITIIQKKDQLKTIKLWIEKNILFVMIIFAQIK